MGESALLIDADDVSSGVTEPRRDLRRVAADGLHDFASVGDNLVNGGGHTINHNVKEEPGIFAGRPSEHPGPAHFTHAVVESDAAIGTFPDVPAERFPVEVGRALGVFGWHFDVADFSVGKRRRHQQTLPQILAVQPSYTAWRSHNQNPIFTTETCRGKTKSKANTKTKPENGREH